jgi:hypothetical protein
LVEPPDLAALISSRISDEPPPGFVAWFVCPALRSDPRDEGSPPTRKREPLARRQGRRRGTAGEPVAAWTLRRD